MWKALTVLVIAAGLSGCTTTPVDRPCGVIIDSLIDVDATTPDGQRRINVHHARGRAAGCWQ